MIYLTDFILAPIFVLTALFCVVKNKNPHTAITLCIDFIITAISGAYMPDPWFFVFVGVKSVFMMALIRYYDEKVSKLVYLVLFSVTIVAFSTALEEQTGYSVLYDRYSYAMFLIDIALMYSVLRGADGAKRRNTRAAAGRYRQRVASNRYINH